MAILKRSLGKQYEVSEIAYFQNNIYLRREGTLHLTRREIDLRETIYVLFLAWHEYPELIPDSITSTLFRRLTSRLMSRFERYKLMKNGVDWKDRAIFNKVLVALITEGVLTSRYRSGVSKPAWILSFNRERIEWVKQHPFVNAHLLEYDFNEIIGKIYEKVNSQWVLERESLLRKVDSKRLDSESQNDKSGLRKKLETKNREL